MAGICFLLIYASNGISDEGKSKLEYDFILITSKLASLPTSIYFFLLFFFVLSIIQTFWG